MKTVKINDDNYQVVYKSVECKEKLYDSIDKYKDYVRIETVLQQRRGAHAFFSTCLDEGLTLEQALDNYQKWVDSAEEKYNKLK